jgi:thioredoxin 1
MTTTSAPGAIRTLTDASFAEAIATADRPVLVEFTAAWCPPCRALTPVLEQLATDLADRLEIVAVDIDRELELVRRHDVRGAPTMVLYVGGVVADVFVGGRGRARLLEDLAPHL